MGIYILLDRSGSMSSMWNEAIGGINGYVAALSDNPEISIHFAAFDSVDYKVVRNTTVGKWEPVGINEITPRGGTPLNDAACHMMTRILEDNDKKSVFVVVTDGYENASQRYGKDKVSKMLKQLEAKDYDVTFLGANFDNVSDVSTGYNFALNKTVAVKDNKFSDWFSTNLATRSRGYFDGAIVGSAAYTVADREAAGETVKK